MSFRIRPATGADNLGAAAVVQAVFEEYGFTWEAEGYCADLYDLEAHYLALGHPFWVAESGDDIVATCGLHLFPAMPGDVGSQIEVSGKIRAAGADCSLERLYVRPDVRRSGLGTSLLSVAVDKALDLGRTAMEIWSDKKLTKAHRLYEKYGAVNIGDRICDDPDESPEWGMILVVTAELATLLRGQAACPLLGR